MRTRQTWLRVALIALFAAYALCLITTALAAFVVVKAVEDSCALTEDGWGRWRADSWSWLSLGQPCTYDLPLADTDGTTTVVRHVDPPSPFVTTTVVLLVGPQQPRLWGGYSEVAPPAEPPVEPARVTMRPWRSRTSGTDLARNGKRS